MTAVGHGTQGSELVRHEQAGSRQCLSSRGKAAGHGTVEVRDQLVQGFGVLDATAERPAVRSRERVTHSSITVKIRVEDLCLATDNLRNKNRLWNCAVDAPDAVQPDAAGNREKVRRAEHVRTVQGSRPEEPQ